MYVGPAKVGAAASGLARFTIGARVSETGTVEVYAGEPLAPSDKTYYRARIARATRAGRLPLFRESSGVCHIYRFRVSFFFSSLFPPKTCPAEARVRVRRSRSIRETGRVSLSPVSFRTSIDSSESSVKYLDNERGRAFFEGPGERRLATSKRERERAKYRN